jgi:glycerophosphoryl diester phosphodiesterase
VSPVRLRHAAFALATLLPLAPYASAAARACAHRGDVEHAPENTVPAIVSAARKRAPQIEFDVKRSRDGQLIVIHDPTLQRTSNGSGKAAELTFDQLRRLDFGSWFGAAFAGTRIPTLREVVAAVPPDLLLNVHLDAASTAVAVPAAKTIAEMGRLASVFFAATEEHAAELRTVYPSVRICNMSRQAGDLNAYVDRTIALKAEFIQLRDTSSGRIPEGLGQAVEKLHRHHVTVNYFGAQDEAKIRALAAAGVDFILTDQLDLCMKILAEPARR